MNNKNILIADSCASAAHYITSCTKDCNYEVFSAYMDKSLHRGNLYEPDTRVVYLGERNSGKDEVLDIVLENCKASLIDKVSVTYILSQE